MIPELEIHNCDFEYFLNEYESLINVETETLWKVSAKILGVNTDSGSYYFDQDTSFITQKKDFYFSNGQDRGAKITIKNSKFRHSRFCKGMLVYRASYVEKEMRSLTNLTHLFMSSPRKLNFDSFLLIDSSEFINLNAFT